MLTQAGFAMLTQAIIVPTPPALPNPRRWTRLNCASGSWGSCVGLPRPPPGICALWPLPKYLARIASRINAFGGSDVYRVMALVLAPGVSVCVAAQSAARAGAE